MAAEYPIGELKVKPHDHTKLLLGSYQDNASPRGFSVHISPESETASVSSSIISLDKPSGIHSLFINIENFGNKTVKAQVWPI